MKKLFLGIIIFFLGLQSIISQDKITQIKSIEIAYQLIDYGTQESSPTALLNAAEMLIQNQYKKLSTSETDKKSSGNDFISEIINKAENLAPNDELTCLWATQLKAFLEDKNYRGVLDTVKYDCNEIKKKSSISYENLQFSTNEKAEVFIHIINNANLTLTISPTNNKEYTLIKLINGMSATWKPEKDTNYTISITNNSNNPAYYELFLN